MPQSNILFLFLPKPAMIVLLKLVSNRELRTQDPFLCRILTYKSLTLRLKFPSLKLLSLVNLEVLSFASNGSSKNTYEAEGNTILVQGKSC